MRSSRPLPPCAPTKHNCENLEITEPTSQGRKREEGWPPTHGAEKKIRTVKIEQ
jgi:hypothetical protein